MSHCRRTIACFLFATSWIAIQSGFLLNAVSAQDTWTSPTGGFFDVGFNWADGTAPGVGESALFNLAATYDVNWDSITGNTTNSGLTIDAGEVTFFSSGGSFSHSLTNDAVINGGHLLLRGNSPTQTMAVNVGGALELGSLGSLTVLPGSELNVDGIFDINGNLNILVGGVVNNNSSFSTAVGIDSIASSTAVVDVFGGQWNAGSLEVGLNQNGEVNVSGGGVIITDDTAIGGNSGIGRFNISGESRMNNAGSLIVGRASSGSLNISEGALVTSVDSNIGNGSNSGSVLISGSGSRLETSGLMEIGVPGLGTGNGLIRIEDGGVMTTGSAFVTEATVVIAGTDSRWTNAGRLNFGNGLESDLSQFIRVRNGGTLESDEILLLDNSWLRIQDANSSVTTTGDIFVGGFGDRGLLTVQNNASLNIAGRLFIGLTGGAGDVQLFGGGATLTADQVEVGPNGHLAILQDTQLTTERLWLSGIFNLEEGIVNVTDSEFTLNIDQSSLSALNPVLELDDSTLNVAGQAVFGSGVEVLIDSSANFSSASVINNGMISVTSTAVLGSNSRHDGYGGNGTLGVGSASVTLLDAGLADLGRITNISGGTLTAANGISIGTGDTIDGFGVINARISGADGSAIYANDGDLTLGDAAHVAGFSTSGEVYTLANSLTILDNNQARLGSYTQLGDASGSGYLQVDNGAIINFGDNLVGYGTIDNQDTLATAIINNGTMRGNSITDRLIVEGYVKGVGTFDNVQFNGTFAPGLSPSCVDGTNFFFGSSSNLEMEIGGLVRCAEYDAIRASGLLALDGTLDVILINGFDPDLGDTFDLFDWGTLDGEFANFDLPTLNAGLRWDLSGLYTTGTLSVSAVPEPACLLFAGFGAIGYSLRRRRI